MMSYLLIFGVFMLLSWLVSHKLKSKFRKYSLIPMNNETTGRDVAEKMLRDNGIYGVKIISIDGELTDHYNPANKTINLSKEVYYGNHISAGAIAAHECGHAIQHANAYGWLGVRSALVPVVSFTSNWVQWVLLAGVLLVGIFPQLLLLGIVIFAITTLFSLITLPVEINASNRAIEWLIGSGVTSYQIIPKAQDALRWAAYTYVIAALGSLATLFYYILIYLGKRE
ncbi:MAG: zinc metallopeptidase [Tenuifilaceae bacterium]